MTILSLKLFGFRTKQEPVVQLPRLENPLLDQLRGITPEGQRVQASRESEAVKQGFLTDLDEVRQVVVSLEDTLLAASKAGRNYADIYRSNSAGPEGLRGLSRPAFDYLERQGFHPTIRWGLDALGRYHMITVQW